MKILASTLVSALVFIAVAIAAAWVGLNVCLQSETFANLSEIQASVNITGTLANPRVSLDTSALITQALGILIPSFLGEKGPVADLLDDDKLGCAATLHDFAS